MCFHLIDQIYIDNAESYDMYDVFCECGAYFGMIEKAKSVIYWYYTNPASPYYS